MSFNVVMEFMLPEKDLKDSIIKSRKRQLPLHPKFSCRLVHWCHGGPGLVMVLDQGGRAVEAPPAWRAAAAEGAADVWRRGLLSKVRLRATGGAGHTVESRAGSRHSSLSPRTDPTPGSPAGSVVHVTPFTLHDCVFVSLRHIGGWKLWRVVCADQRLMTYVCPIAMGITTHANEE